MAVVLRERSFDRAYRSDMFDRLHTAIASPPKHILEVTGAVRMLNSTGSLGLRRLGSLGFFRRALQESWRSEANNASAIRRFARDLGRISAAKEEGIDVGPAFATLLQEAEQIALAALEAAATARARIDSWKRVEQELPGVPRADLWRGGESAVGASVGWCQVWATACLGKVQSDTRTAGDLVEQGLIHQATETKKDAIDDPPQPQVYLPSYGSVYQRINDHPANSAEYRAHTQAVCDIARPDSAAQVDRISQGVCDLAGALDERVHSWDAFVQELARGGAGLGEEYTRQRRVLAEVAERARADVTLALDMLSA